MSSVSKLILEHSRVFERPESQWPESVARVRFDFDGGGKVESWFAATEHGRLLLRPTRAGDPAPHLTFRMAGPDFERYVSGKTDIFVGASNPSFELDFKGRGDLSELDLFFFVMRIFAGLCLSCQCRDRFRGTLMERLYLSWRSVREDGAYEPMGNWSLPYYGGELLYDLVCSKKLRSTLEVGLAHGLSALFVAQSHHDNGGGRHIAIDPCQASWFGGCGIKNLEEAGLRGFVEVIEEPNYVALPRLLHNPSQRFQLIFLDGLHIFDHVLLDFFYGDRLLEVGGYVVFDDSGLPAVKDALSFVSENRFDSFERLEDLSNERITVFKKTADDVRIDKYGVLFHRPFTSTLPMPSPVPPRKSPSVLKYRIDRALAMLGVIVFLPLGILIALAIVLEDFLRGAGMFAPLQRAASISAGERIDMLLFRTVKRGGMESGKSSSVGTILKKLRLDNLPLLWNVLCGKMSFVGLRPIPVGDRRRRELFRECGIRSGLTGLHHVRGSPDTDIEYYREYVKRSTASLLAFDLSVLARAVRRKVFKR